MPMPPTSKTDGGDDPAAHAGVADRDIDLVGPVFLGLKGKIFDSFMRVHQDVVRLLQGWFQVIDIRNFDRESRELWDRAMCLCLWACGISSTSY